MKILVVQDRLRSGGTERQSVLLTRGFEAAGHEARLLTFRPGGALASSAAGLRVESLQSRDRGLDWWAPGLQRRVREDAPEVVLCMGRMANCYAGSLQDADRSRAVIATLRTGKPLPWLFRRSLQKVRHVVANSQEAKARAVGAVRQRAAEFEAKISVIHNALVFAPEPASLSAARPAARAEWGIDPATVVLLNVAMFRPEKNQLGLIEAVAKLPRDPKWQLWLVGDGPERSRCRRLAEKYGLAEQVRFLGWVPDPTPFYRAADIAVHASRRESLSNFLIESQAHGLPVVAFDAVGVRETFVDEESGYRIAPDQVDEFCRALNRLIGEPDRRAAMGERGREWARTAFAPVRQVHAYLDLFHRLLHAPSP